MVSIKNGVPRLYAIFTKKYDTQIKNVQNYDLKV